MKKFLLFAFIFFAFQITQAEDQKMSQAYEEELIQRVKSVFSSQAAVEAPERPICATPIFLEVRANWDKLSARAKGILQSQIERPSYSFTEYTYDTPQDHFKIHYVREGNNAVYNPDADYNVNGQPDWVDTVATVLEHVWDTEINVFGYNSPPSDTFNPDTADIGGDGRYDIYLLDVIAQGYLGYTQGEYFVSPQSISATSYIVLDNDYIRSGHTQLEWLQVTAAHEFFHAIQMGYDGTEYEEEPFRPYWMEMSAVWMEDMVYDNVNDYLGYLPHFFNYPWLSLKTYRSMTDQHAYGSCIWPMFLQERFDDTTIIKSIWEECAKVAGDNAIDCPGCLEGKSATDIVLAEKLYTFEEAFREFTMWNYFTGDRARAETYYSEGEDFPEVMVEGLHYHTTYPVFSPSGPSHPENLGSNYVIFVPDLQLGEGKGGIRIVFDGNEGDFGVSAIGYKSYPHAPLETSFIGLAEIYNWASYLEVIMIPAVLTRNPDYFWTYEYQAFYDSSLIGGPTSPEGDRILQNYPNPFVMETESDRTFFPFVLSSPSRVRIDIFNLSGERIKTITPRRDIILSSEEYVEQPVLQELRLFWDGTNEEGEFVSSGIYLYTFRTDRTTEVKKIAVIR